VRSLTLALTLAVLGVTATPALATPDGPNSPKPVTYAIIGDTPYGAAAIARFPSDIAQINAASGVSRVVHLGDIKNGSSRCDTSYFNLIRADFDTFADPFVYTPGDNEWTDCHRANNGGYQPAGPEIPGAPVVTGGPSRLDEVRRIFFPTPGKTLGQNAVAVDAQAAPYVENVRWEQSRAMWVTLNVPGSDNDGLPWFGAAETPALIGAQTAERTQRTDADLTWLREAFAAADHSHSRAVVIALQADMWDPNIVGDPTQYADFTPIVRAIADLTREFGKPVLLLNGDSHIYESDHPLAEPASVNNTIYGIGEAVPNLMRITVDGSNNANDWLRLTIDPKDDAIFSWTRVPLI
jgi:hypothetical protein